MGKAVHTLREKLAISCGALGVVVCALISNWEVSGKTKRQGDVQTGAGFLEADEEGGKIFGGGGASGMGI